jgi:phosphoserine aminotransferase
MTRRVWNFAAGPAMLPEPVLEHARDGIADLSGSGMSILEVSHRSPWFEEVIGEAEQGLRELLDVSDRHRVLFCQGGASLQFSMVAMNLLRPAGRPAHYAVTGSWSAKAVAEGRREGDAIVAWDGSDEGFVRVPDDQELTTGAPPFGSGAAYAHFTSNETIQGVEWPGEPAVPADTPLVSDMSSDFLSRPVDVSRYGLIYAGAQKNAGPAGVTIVIARDDLLERAAEDVPPMLDYRTYARTGSRYNTPPTFAIYVVMLVTRWLRDEIGGLERMAERNRQKASVLYEAIDASGGFYRGHARPDSRSRMNVTFRLPSEDLEREFRQFAEDVGLLELGGHRSVGGLRASIYNAMPLEGVTALREAMEEFRQRRG